MRVQITFENDDGEEETFVFPAHNEVCPECDGNGTVLCEGMRGHAYSAEEFAESFDEDEAAEYFRRGGMYDVQCPTCCGANVVPVIDRDACNAEQRAALARFDAQERERAEYDRACEAERRMGA